MLKSIQKKVKNLGSLLKFFSNKLSSSKLPFEIDDGEKIIRSIFSPINVDKKNKLRTNVFKSPSGMDEVSVNRLYYTTPDFCKQISKNIQSQQRTYFGLALLTAKEIRNAKAKVIYSPIKNENVFHADIKVGYVREKGVPAPSHINHITTKLKDQARFYIDPNPNVENWTGPELL